MSRPCRPAGVGQPRQRHGPLDLVRDKASFGHMKNNQLDPAILGDIIEMALSDHVSFAQIRALYGLGPDEVKAATALKNTAPEP